MRRRVNIRVKYMLKVNKKGESKVTEKEKNNESNK